MAGNVGIASTQIIDELFKSIDTAWTAMDLTKSTLAETLSFYTTSPRSATLSHSIYLIRGRNKQQLICKH